MELLILLMFSPRKMSTGTSAGSGFMLKSFDQIPSSLDYFQCLNFICKERLAVGNIITIALLLTCNFNMCHYPLLTAEGDNHVIPVVKSHDA